MLYARVALKTGQAGQPANLPDHLVGLDDTSLANLSLALSPTPLNLKDVGYWPVDIVELAVDASRQTPSGTYVVAPDVEARRVTATPVLRDLTAAETAALAARPRTALGKLEFTVLVQAVGGMTDAMLVAAYKDPRFEAFWIKMQLASEVLRDHPVTTQALAGLEGAGYLPNGSQAVLGAWPLQ